MTSLLLADRYPISKMFESWFLCFMSFFTLSFMAASSDYLSCSCCLKKTEPKSFWLSKGFWLRKLFMSAKKLLKERLLDWIFGSLLVIFFLDFRTSATARKTLSSNYSFFCCSICSYVTMVFLRSMRSVLLRTAIRLRLLGLLLMDLLEELADTSTSSSF